MTFISIQVDLNANCRTRESFCPARRPSSRTAAFISKNPRASPNDFCHATKAAILKRYDVIDFFGTQGICEIKKSRLLSNYLAIIIFIYVWALHFLLDFSSVICRFFCPDLYFIDISPLFPQVLHERFPEVAGRLLVAVIPSENEKTVAPLRLCSMVFCISSSPERVGKHAKLNVNTSIFCYIDISISSIFCYTFSAPCSFFRLSSWTEPWNLFSMNFCVIRTSSKTIAHMGEK